METCEKGNCVKKIDDDLQYWQILIWHQVHDFLSMGVIE